MTLLALKAHNIGWAKQIEELLETWGLEQNWNEIKQKPFPVWKSEVKVATELKNKDRIKEECEKTHRGESKTKTKTIHALNSINSDNYIRKPDHYIDNNSSILHTRALIMGRFGMLTCANNFSHGHGSKLCDSCNVTDDETHRINYCKKWHKINLYDNHSKIDFNDIYLDDFEKCAAVVNIVLKMWDLENGKNAMRNVL